MHIIKMLELYALLNLVRLVSEISQEFCLMEKFKCFHQIFCKHSDISEQCVIYHVLCPTITLEHGVISTCSVCRSM